MYYYIMNILLNVVALRFEKKKVIRRPAFIEISNPLCVEASVAKYPHNLRPVSGIQDSNVQKENCISSASIESSHPLYFSFSSSKIVNKWYAKKKFTNRPNLTLTDRSVWLKSHY